MTISATTNRMDYTGNGATATYSYTFKIFAKNDLKVTKRDNSNVETLLVVDTDYTVTGVGNSAGGSITLTAGNLTSGYKLTIRRARALKQETDIRNQGDFYPEVHEDALDNSVMIDQTQQEEIDRSMKLPETVTGVSVTLPIPVGGYYLRMNEAGTALELVQNLGTVANPMSAKGDLLTRDASSTVRLPVGADGDPLVADSTDSKGIAWGARTKLRKIVDPYVDVRAFLPVGFVTDGSVNYATELQAAFDYAKNSDLPVYIHDIYGSAAKLNIVRPNNDIKGMTVFGRGQGLSGLKYLGAASIGTLLDIDGTTSGYTLNNFIHDFKLDLTNAPAGTIGLKINAGVWRSRFERLFVTRDVPAGVRTGVGIYMGSTAGGDVGCYDNKFSDLYVNHFSRNLHFQGTDLSGNTITNCPIDHSYISDGDYNLYAEYYNGLSANNTQLEDARTAGAYFVWGETAVFIGGSIESSVAGAKGIDMDANTRSVIALCDFFNNAGGHFTANGQIGHLYKASNSGFVYVAGSEIRLDKDASYTSYLRFFKNGIADVRMKAGASGDTLGITNAAGTEHFSFDATNAVLNLLSATGILRLHSGADLRFYQSGVDTRVMAGAGTPEGVVTANRGSLYLRTDGGAATSMYIKESGVGNTGWIAK